MNKLGKRQYIQLITKALNDCYGNTLWEDETDIRMAKKVLKVLIPYLYFHPFDISSQEFNEWKKIRTPNAKEDYNYMIARKNIKL